MNINVLYGIISFVAWSVFSTWYYVNYIKDFPREEIISEAKSPEENTTATQEPEPTPEISKEEVLPSISVNKQFFFDLDASNLSNKGIATSYFDSLKSIVDSQSINAKIVGHTCDLGSESYNLILAEKRAIHIAKFLDDRFTISSISIDAKGESEPLVPNSNEENRAKNRRVTVSLKTDEK